MTTSGTTTSGTSTQNVTVTWTGRMRQRHNSGGWIYVLDGIGHGLHLPRWIMRPVCDHYDIRAGIPKADLIAMDYTRQGRKTPWWLR